MSSEFVSKMDSSGSGVGGSGYGMKDILENKWTTIVKMKKQVMDLEKQNKQLKESQICERCGGGVMGNELNAGKSGQIGDGLPKVPATRDLIGHR